MRKGAESFVTFSLLAVPTILLAAVLTGSSAVLLGFIGLFFVLRQCNNLDKSTISRGRK